MLNNSGNYKMQAKTLKYHFAYKNGFKKKCQVLFLLGEMARLGKELDYLEIPFKCQKVKKNLRKRRAYLKVKGATSRASNGQIWDRLSRKINSNEL